MYRIYIDNLAWDDNGSLKPHHEQLLYMLGVDELTVLNPKLTIEVNKAGSLEFKMPYDHPFLEEVHELCTTVIVRRDDQTIWKGRITKIDRDFYRNANIYAEGALSFLNDTLVPSYSYTNGVSVKTLFELFITKHAEQASSGRKIELITKLPDFTEFCDVTAVSWEIEHYPELVGPDADHPIDPNQTNIKKAENKSYPQTLEEITSVLVDEYGGYLYLTYGANDTYYIGYYQKYGGLTEHRSKQKIMFGVNLLDYSESVSAEDLFTRFRPVGGSDLVISTNDGFLENQMAIRQFGKISRTETWSDIESVDELTRKGRKHLLEGSRLSQTIAIKAVDLHILNPDIEDEIELGDKVGVFSAPHNVNREYICSQITIDLQDPSNTEYIFGDVYSSLTGTSLSGNATSVELSSQAENATF